MNDIRRIEEFLKIIASASKSGMHIDKDVVYSNLIYFGIKNKRCDISHNFNYWIEYFENIPNVRAFVDPNWSYFCQFINSNYGRFVENCNIKLYIPVDSEHITKSAQMIFGFLAKENIPHVSKIGKRVRIDDIVIRVNTRENAEKIINFVNNEKYIKDGILSNSPFAIRDNNVAISWDGQLSYNEVVSSWVSYYINWENENNRLDSVSYSRFFAFVQKKCYSLFTKGEGLQEYASLLCQEGVLEDFDYEDAIDCGLANYYDVTKLFLLSLIPGNTKEDVYHHIDMIYNENYQRKIIDKIHSLRVPRVKEKKKFSDEQRNAFRLSYERMVEKYGYDDTKLQFLEFMEKGDYTYITRYGGARELLKSNRITKEVAFEIVSSLRNEMLENALISMYNEYGYDQVYNAFYNLLKFHDFSYFMDNNLIEELKIRFGDYNMLKYVYSSFADSGYGSEISIDEMCRLYIDKIIKKTEKNRISL